MSEEKKLELPPIPDYFNENNLEDYITFLEQLRRFKQHITVVPTDIPSSFLNQIRFYDDGTGTVKLFLFVNGVWRSISIS